jgi:Zn-dependent protease
MNVIEFFKRQLLVAHVFGIPVRIDYRWFVVLIVVAWLTAVNLPVSEVESFALRFVFGLIATIVFFASILFHELAHAWTARREGIDVLEIVLHPFGGLARMRREPDTPRAEFRIAVAGPVASFLLALVFLAGLAVAREFDAVIPMSLFAVLFFGNLMLAIFNLFPGYPLDGGRVLRAFLWRRGTDLNEATVITGRAGQIISIALITVGVFFAVVRGDISTGIWTVLVGVFLLDAASGIIKQVKNLENLRVEEVMMMPVAVAPDASVAHFVDHVLPLHRQTVFPVAENRQFYGVLRLEDLKKIEREHWRNRLVSEIMLPVRHEYFVDTGTALSEARELMRENGIGALGVLDEQGNLVGFLQRGRIRKRQ